ncbi:hypothetical protein [Sphingobium sp. LSP13-1-1.1]|uniref:hypothetical protein n=1 Tax=Sphingobium sp. LSP13-1-1.1 TaxID=3135234 RepID=UPI003436E60E
MANCRVVNNPVFDKLEEAAAVLNKMLIEELECLNERHSMEGAFIREAAEDYGEVLRLYNETLRALWVAQHGGAL